MLMTSKRQTIGASSVANFEKPWSTPKPMARKNKGNKGYVTYPPDRPEGQHQASLISAQRTEFAAPRFPAIAKLLRPDAAGRTLGATVGDPTLLQGP